MTNEYTALKGRHQQEVNDFPFFFAFDNKQFKQGMEKFGLTPDDTDKIYRLGGTGGHYLRTDALRLHAMFERQQQEMQAAIAADKTGTGFVYDMFSHELANHEYGFTYDVTDALEALGMTEQEVNSNPVLKRALTKARKNIKDAFA